MKVVLSPHAEESLPVQYASGLTSYASFSRIIMAMEAIKRTTAADNQKCLSDA